MKALWDYVSFVKCLLYQFWINKKLSNAYCTINECQLYKSNKITSSPSPSLLSSVAWCTCSIKLCNINLFLGIRVSPKWKQCETMSHLWNACYISFKSIKNYIMLIVKLMNVDFTSRTKLHHHLAQVYFCLLLDVPVLLQFLV